MGRESKDKNELEHLRGVVRNLKSENRHLKKELARTSKQKRRAEAIADIGQVEVEDTELEVTQPKSKCVKCHGSVQIIELGPRTIHACLNPDCRHRKTIKT